jgi:hypothetical protein
MPTLLLGCVKNRKAQRTIPCACTFVDPEGLKKVIYNQITRFFSREYRVSLLIIDTSWQTFESTRNDELLTYQADQHCQGRGLSG